MAESSLLQSVDEQELLQAALDHPFEPAEVTLSSPSVSFISSAPTSNSIEPADVLSSSAPSTEEATWQTDYAAHVSEWRAQSASVRSKAELTRAQWEAMRAREADERRALGQPPESWDHLGDHITTSTAAASEVVAHTHAHPHSHSLSASVASLAVVEHADLASPSLSRLPSQTHARPEESPERSLQQGRTDAGSPSQPWEHITSSPASSYPSMSFPDASLPQSPSHPPVLLVPTSTSTATHVGSHPLGDQDPSRFPPSTLPSIMDKRISTRTRLSLVLSSLAINLLLPFINGVMLGFGEIFAKDVLVGWIGWKTTRPGSTAAHLGLRR